LLKQGEQENKFCDVSKHGIYANSAGKEIKDRPKIQGKRQQVFQ
jgi:hypothetical protein